MTSEDASVVVRQDEFANRFWRVVWIVLLIYANVWGISHAFRDCNRSSIVFFSLLPLIVVMVAFTYATTVAVLKGEPQNAGEVWRDAVSFWVKQYQWFPTLTTLLTVLLALTFYSQFFRFDIRHYGVYTDSDGGKSSHVVMYDRLTGGSSRFEQYCAPPDENSGQ